MRDDIRRDEFEGRNRQLPADLDQTASYASSAQARRDMESTPHGTPPNCYDVRSVYDSRPINAVDFNVVATVNFTGSEAMVVSKIAEMTVPEGYVAVLRNVRMWFEPVYGTARSDVSAALTLSGGDVPYNVDMLVGGDERDITSFVIGNEFNRLGLRVTLNAGLLLSDDFDCYVWFYGNLLLKSERPAAFEIANPSQDPACRIGAPVQRSVPPTPTVTVMPEPASAPVAPVAPARRPAPLTLAISNVVSATGRGGARVVVRDFARATLPGGLRPLTREEYYAYRADIDRYIEANRRFAPSLQPLVM